MDHGVWRITKAATLGFIADSCLSRGAAIAYYSIFALAPVLVLVIATAGLVFGEAAARGAIVEQISGVMGQQSADTIQAMIQGVGGQRAGILATVIGGITLLFAASGVFGEVQAALNAIWKVEPPHGAITQLVRSRLQGLALVLIMGFLLLSSLVVSAALAAAGTWLPGLLPLHLLNFATFFVIIAASLAAIYRVLPDTPIDWRDVGGGALVTAILFTLGKYLIGLYVARSSLISSFGAASTFAVVLVWIYYCCQIFLFGAELTYVFAQQRGSHRVVAPARGSAGQVAELRLALEANTKRRRARRS